MKATNLKQSAVLVSSAIAMALSMAAVSAPAQAAETEKCYGVAKAGKNDCATAHSSCASSAKTDGQKDAWIMVPKGTCAKIVGGSLTDK